MAMVYGYARVSTNLQRNSIESFLTRFSWPTRSFTTTTTKAKGENREERAQILFLGVVSMHGSLQMLFSVAIGQKSSPICIVRSCRSITSPRARISHAKRIHWLRTDHEDFVDISRRSLERAVLDRGVGCSDPSGDQRRDIRSAILVPANRAGVEAVDRGHRSLQASTWNLSWITRPSRLHTKSNCRF